MNRLAGLSAAASMLATTALADGGHLVVAEWTDVGANWAMYAEEVYIGARSGCYEGLTRISNSVRVEPSLATSWEQTDPNTWVFQIREGVTFQDGTPLTAEAVAGALTNLLEAPVPARAISKKVVDSVEATGAMEVTIRTPSPQVSLPGRLAAPDATILAPAAYVAEGVIDPIGHCTGPMKMVEVDPRQFVRLERYDDYWGEVARLDSAEFLFVPDDNTRATMVRSGEVQIARLIPPTVAANVEAEQGVSVINAEVPRIVEVLLNNSRPPFDNPDARRAVRAAIDVAAIAAAVYEGLAAPADDPFRDGDAWEAPNVGVVTPDMAEAKALLEGAGVDPGGLELEMLVYDSKPALGMIAEVVQASLSELGIKVNIRVAAYSALEADLLAGNHDLAMMSRGYLTDVPEPIGFLAADYGCEGGFNISQHCNPEIDAKIAAASAEVDADARFGAYAEIAQYLYDEAVTIFVVNETELTAVSDKVLDFVPHPLNYTLVTNTVSVAE